MSLRSATSSHICIGILSPVIAMTRAGVHRSGRRILRIYPIRGLRRQSGEPCSMRSETCCWPPACSAFFNDGFGPQGQKRCGHGKYPGHRAQLVALTVLGCLAYLKGRIDDISGGGTEEVREEARAFGRKKPRAALMVCVVGVVLGVGTLLTQFRGTLSWHEFNSILGLVCIVALLVAGIRRIVRSGLRKGDKSGGKYL